MSNIQSNSNSTAVIANRASELVGTDVKTWTTVFVLSSLMLMVLQPSAVIASALAVCLMMTMVIIAHASVAHFENEATFGSMQHWITLLAPVQFACLIWVAVHLGRMIVGTTIATSSFIALAALALIVLIDAMLSVSVLLTVERKQGASGLSVAALLSSKYAGLFGKIA